eukprot:13942579-Ditylum_brightwellii.AAC.1
MAGLSLVSKMVLNWAQMMASKMTLSWVQLVALSLVSSIISSWDWMMAMSNCNDDIKLSR